MAYMSNVTHHKLVGKYTPTPDGWGGQHASITYGEEHVSAPRDLGVVSCGSFEAPVRCCATYGNTGSIRDTMTWTGESDGTICIRRAWTGEVQCTIERKKGVFVSVLKYHGQYMYAGMSDGYLRAFQEDDMGGYELVDEAKKHTGDILCIESVGSNIFTGSRDWQVFVWRWEAGRLCSVDQFAGHQLAVRCLAYERGLLYSGGDDRVIRCINMETGEEVTTATGFPIAGTRGGIKALCAVENALFSGDEENINVWDARTGDHLKLLLKSEGAIMTLMKDPHGARVWSGGVDGVIRLWDARGSFDLLSELDEHNGSFVRGLVSLSRVSAAKTWTINKEGQLQMWYSESDCSEFDASTSAEEHALASSVDSLRDVIVQNYTKLEEHKAQLHRVQQLEANRKAMLADTLGRVCHTDIKRRYFSKLMSRLAAYRKERKARTLVETLMLSTKLGLLSVYYHKWARFMRTNKAIRRKQTYCQALMRTTDKSLQVLYYRKLKEYARLVMIRRRKAELAETLLRSVTGGLQRSVILKLQRFALLQRQKKKRRSVSHTLFRHTKNGLLFIYYGKLVAYFRREKDASKKGTLTDTLLHTLYRSTRHAYFMKWLRWYKRRTDVGRRDRVANILVRTTTHGVLRVYFTKLMENRMEKQCELMEMKHNDMLKNVKKLEMKLRAAQYITEEELTVQIKKLEDEGDSLDEVVGQLEREVEALKLRGSQLERELKGHVQFDTETPVQERLLRVCCFLKARGVSCRRDIRSITDCSKDHDKGVKTFQMGVLRVKRSVQQGTDQPCNMDERDWRCSTEAVRYFDKKLLAEVHKGVKDIIIGVDQMHYYRVPFPVEQATEVVENIHVLYECVSRIFADRIATEEDEWRTKQKVRELDPYATQHGKLVNKGLQRVNSTKQDIADLVNRDRDNKPNAPDRRERMGESQRPHERHDSQRPRSNSGKRKATSSPSRRPAATPVSAPEAAPEAEAAAVQRTASADQGLQGEGFVESQLRKAASGSSPPAGKKKPDPGFKLGDNMAVVTMHSMAAKAAGLRVGDVITSVDMHKVADKSAYVKRVKHAKVGQMISFGFTRTSETSRAVHKTARIKLEEL
eukprot:TRINITY_DN25759_c0_g1_i1.p1 TRINITY_DN25759_c0_g1~~TRINITY_DN25759_c0_g1_i1.p1  ORF type:complete len:1093 (+),score=464.49 TRINITY_DN25759_c0_g1_i1:48-3326(+)